MLTLAAAIARRHPALAKAITGPVVTGAPQLVKVWASQLHADLGLRILASEHSVGMGTLVVATDSRDPVFLKKAFERANASMDGLGWRLIDCIDQLSGHNPLITPIDLFYRLCYSQWYEATTDEEFKKNRRDCDGIPEDADEDDDLPPGPDSFWKDFPGLPRDEILGRVGHRRRRKWSARTCRRHANDAKDPWTRELLLAMADGAAFARRHRLPVWHVQPNDAEWEQCAAAYVVRWCEGDDMGNWLDIAYEDSWNSGMGTDATLVFECASARHHKPKEIEASLDQFVEGVEGCAAHIPVMDKLFGVIAEAGAKKCKSNSKAARSSRKR